MRKRFRRLPSPAMAVAFLALLAAIGGTAAALPGKNKVKKDDIAKGAVGATDLAKNAVTGAKIKKNAINGAKIKNDSVAGADVNESTLGKVPSAGTADSAGTANSANSANSANTANTANTANSVGGATIRAFSFAVPGVAPVRTILDLNDLKLEASCNGATLTFNARSAVNDGQLDGYSVQTDQAAGTAANLVNVPDTVADVAVHLVPNDEDDEVGHLRFVKPDGSGVSVEWHAAGSLPSAGCTVTGVASAF